jgi:uncharacterized protein (DUF1778 family)
MKKNQSAILEAVQQTAQGFYRAGVMDKATLREFNYLTLDDAQWNAFLTSLDAPSEPAPRLEKLLKEPSILDTF